MWICGYVVMCISCISGENIGEGAYLYQQTEGDRFGSGVESGEDKAWILSRELSEDLLNGPGVVNFDVADSTSNVGRDDGIASGKSVDELDLEVLDGWSCECKVGEDEGHLAEEVDELHVGRLVEDFDCG